jgi:hypothetical protein
MSKMLVIVYSVKWLEEFYELHIFFFEFNLFREVSQITVLKIHKPFHLPCACYMSCPIISFQFVAPNIWWKSCYEVPYNVSRFNCR